MNSGYQGYRQSSIESGELAKNKSFEVIRATGKKHEEPIRAPILVNILNIFAIPLEFRDKDIDQLLYDKNIKFRYRRWLILEDMEFLEVGLYESYPVEYFESADFSLDRCPLVVIPGKIDHAITIQ